MPGHYFEFCKTFLLGFFKSKEEEFRVLDFPEQANFDLLRTFALIVSAHPYCARKFTCHVIHERAHYLIK